MSSDEVEDKLELDCSGRGVSFAQTESFTDHLFEDTFGRPLNQPAVALVTLDVNQDRVQESCQVRDFSLRSRNLPVDPKILNSKDTLSRFYIPEQKASLVVFYEASSNLESGHERCSEPLSPERMVYGEKSVVAYGLLLVNPYKTQEPEEGSSKNSRSNMLCGVTTSSVSASISSLVGKFSSPSHCHVLFRLDCYCLDSLRKAECVSAFQTWRIREDYLVRAKKKLLGEKDLYDWGENSFVGNVFDTSFSRGMINNSASFAADILENFCQVHPIHVEPFVSHPNPAGLVMTCSKARFDPRNEDE